LRQGKLEHDELMAEIRSLKARRSNVPAEQVAMRSALCRALALSEEAMPFAGELLQVRDDERDWEGAAERCCATSACRCWCPTTITRGRRVGRQDPAQWAAGLFPHASECAQ
jgi:uncharacterized protein YPO0396